MTMIWVFLVFFGFVFLMDLILVASVYTILVKAKKRQEKKEVLEEIKRRKEEESHAKDNHSDKEKPDGAKAVQRNSRRNHSVKQQRDRVCSE